MSDRKKRMENVKAEIIDLLAIIDDNFLSAQALSRLEIDLMKEKLRKTYDLLLQVEPSMEKTTYKPTDVVQQSKFLSEMIDETPDIKNEEIIAEEKPVEPETKMQQEESGNRKKEPVSPKPSFVDLFSQQESTPGKKKDKTVLDKISEKELEESVADKIRKQNNIQGLKSAIGINEKFFFINELFKGNMKDYSDAVENLEACQSMPEAESLLYAMEEKYQWKADNEAFIQLKEIVNRKLK